MQIKLTEILHHFSVWLIVTASVAQLIPEIAWGQTRAIWIAGLIMYIGLGFRLNKIATATATTLGLILLAIFFIPLPLPNSIPLLLQLSIRLALCMIPVMITLTLALYAIKITRHNKTIPEPSNLQNKYE